MIPEAPQAPLLAVVPPGEFTMGETADDKFATDTERPAHRVRFERAFGLGRFPVTSGEYGLFAAPRAEDPRLPVAGVSWDDARAYCSWLRAGTGRRYRLPTEAEWEYACRAGGRAPFASGEEIGPADANFLYSEEGEIVGPGRRTPAGRHPANVFGIEDLHGNVCEWVEDAWHPDYLGAPADGSAWSEGGDPGLRVIRGGAWDYLPRLLRCAWRDRLPRDRRRDNVGFRLALSLD